MLFLGIMWWIGNSCQSDNRGLTGSLRAVGSAAEAGANVPGQRYKWGGTLLVSKSWRESRCYYLTICITNSKPSAWHVTSVQSLFPELWCCLDRIGIPAPWLTGIDKPPKSLSQPCFLHPPMPAYELTSLGALHTLGTMALIRGDFIGQLCTGLSWSGSPSAHHPGGRVFRASESTRYSEPWEEKSPYAIKQEMTCSSVTFIQKNFPCSFSSSNRTHWKMFRVVQLENVSDRI